MRSKLMKDILVYILLPILVFNIDIVNHTNIIFQIVFSIAIFYTIFTRYKENRVNITGVVAFFILVGIFTIRKNFDSDEVYFYNTCIILGIALIIPVLKIFNKEVCVIIIKDLLKSLNKNSLVVIKILKKKSIVNELKKISALIETCLISVSLIRILNILIYQCNPNSYFSFISRCIGIIFLGVVIYKTLKLMNESKKLNLNKVNKPTGPGDNSKGKVINFNSFK